MNESERKKMIENRKRVRIHIAENKNIDFLPGEDARLSFDEDLNKLKLKKTGKFNVYIYRRGTRKATEYTSFSCLHYDMK